MGLTVELDHERVGVQEDVVAEVSGATRQAAGVRLGVQDRQPLLERIVNVATGGELDDQRRPLAHGLDGLAQKNRIQAGPVVRVPDVNMDH